MQEKLENIPLSAQIQISKQITIGFLGDRNRAKLKFVESWRFNSYKKKVHEMKQCEEGKVRLLSQHEKENSKKNQEFANIEKRTRLPHLNFMQWR